MFNADIGRTLLYGIIIAIPAIIIAGPIFTRTIKNINATPLKEFYNPEILKDNQMPSMGVSVFTALLPVILIIFSSLYTIVFPSESLIKRNNFIYRQPCYCHAYFSFSSNIYSWIIKGEEDERVNELYFCFCV